MRISCLISLIIIAGATIVPSATLAAQAQPSPDRDRQLQQLQAQIDLLSQQLQQLRAGMADGGHSTDGNAASVEARSRELTARIDALSQQVSRLAETVSQTAAKSTASSAGRTGFTFKSSDGAFSLRIRGYIHSDGRFAGPAGTPSPDTFLMRRVRPVFEATMFRRFSLKLMPDFGEGKTQLQDAFIDLTVNKALKFRTGKFKSPFGLERLVSATELTFTERAMPTQLAPNRDLGILVFGDVAHDVLSYQLAIVNGVVDGSSGDFEERDGKDLVARIVAKPFASRRDSRHVAGIGAAVSVGRDHGFRLAPGVPVFRTAVQQVFFRYRNDVTGQATTVAAGERVRGSVQGYWYAGRSSLSTEITRSHQQVGIGTAISPLDNTAFVVDGSYFLWGKASPRQGGATPIELDRTAKPAGALELVGRATRLDVDPDAFPVFADPALSASSASEVAFGGNWYVNPAVKVSSSFHRTVFGTRDPAGTRRRTEHALLMRLQFVF